MNGLTKFIAAAALLLFTLPPASATSASGGSDITNSKVKNTFNTYFSEAKDIKWWKESTGNFIARFSLNSGKVTAVFNGGGELLYALRYIGEDQLPENLRIKLIKKYPGTPARTITEYFNETDHYYVLLLETHTRWIMLKADEQNGLETLQKLKKAS